MVRKPFWRKLHRKRRSYPRAPVLNVQQILEWADAYHARTGAWPKATRAEAIPETLADTWFRVDKALRDGARH